MRVLITGIDGFTGRYLKQELESKGHFVDGLSSNLTKASEVSKEIRNKQPDAVAHLAGISFAGHGNTNAFYKVHLIGTSNLLNALAKYAPQISSIMLTSSASVYGSFIEGEFSESNPTYPANDYAVSKMAMENMSRIWMSKLPIFIVRPFNYTGVGQKKKFLIPKIVYHFKNKKKTIELGNLNVWREFGDVRSVVSIYRKLLISPPIGEILNICTSKAYSLHQVIKMCEKITEHNIVVKSNPKLCRANEVKVFKGDNTRLKKIVKDIKEIKLQTTLEWMLS